MTAKKQYPLRVDPALWSAVQRWADDELRSVNGQMEFIIRDALRRAGRLPQHTDPGHTNARTPIRKSVSEPAVGSAASGDVANDTARNSANDAGNAATDSHTAGRNESGSSH